MPKNSSAYSITNNLNKLNIKTTSLPSKTIRELVPSIPQRNIFSDTSVYCIPCKDCKLIYIGKTSRNLHVRLKEHKRDIRIGNSKNALFLHISQHKHNFDFNSAKMLTYIHNKNLRRIFEATVSHSLIPLICYMVICRFMQKESQRHNDKGRAKTSLEKYVPLTLL